MHHIHKCMSFENKQAVKQFAYAVGGVVLIGCSSDLGLLFQWGTMIGCLRHKPRHKPNMLQWYPI